MEVQEKTQVFYTKLKVYKGKTTEHSLVSSECVYDPRIPFGRSVSVSGDL